MGEQSEVFTVPARRGRAARLDKGQAIKVVNTHGQQVVDFWAFNAADLGEYLSMEHLRATLEGIFPKAGDDLVTNRRRPILHFAEDTSPGIHDTLFTCCDRFLYEQLGCTEYHRNCADNLVEAMQAIGHEPSRIPDPLNLFMNIPVSDNLGIAIAPPVSRPGDHVTLLAECPSIVALSACPMDLMPINATDQTPRDVALEISS